MILVVGATGRLGRAVTAALIAGGHQVRAGCRNPGQAKDLAALGADVVPIDLRDRSGFSAALAGADQVVAAVQGLTARPADAIARVDLEGHCRLIEAAEKAGTKRFIYVSAQGASASHPAAFARAKAAVEAALAASGLQHTILRPSAFMDLYAHDIIGKAVLAGRRVVLLGNGHTPRNLVAVADVAAAVVAAAEGRVPDRITHIAGPSNLSDREVAAVYGRLGNRPARITSLSPAVLAGIAAVIGPFHAGVRNLLLFGGQNEQHGSMVADASHMAGLIGREPQSLEAFVAQRLA